MKAYAEVLTPSAEFTPSSLSKKQATPPRAATTRFHVSVECCVNISENKTFLIEGICVIRTKKKSL